MQDKPSSAPAFSPQHWCFGCGELNPEGLRIKFKVDGLKVTGRFTGRKEHQGFPGVAHGGLAATVMDEAMGWAMYAVGAWAMTARMEVKYRKPVPLEEEVIVTAEVVRDRGRWLEAVSEIRSASGERLSEAKGIFVRLPDEVAQKYKDGFVPDEEPARS